MYKKIFFVNIKNSNLSEIYDSYMNILLLKKDDYITNKILTGKYSKIEYKIIESKKPEYIIFSYSQRGGKYFRHKIEADLKIKLNFYTKDTESFLSITVESTPIEHPDSKKITYVIIDVLSKLINYEDIINNDVIFNLQEIILYNKYKRSLLLDDVKFYLFLIIIFILAYVFACALITH
jgi:hypothetical protein